MATRKRKDLQENPLMSEVLESSTFIPVEGNRDLARDSRSGAILNINKKAYHRAMALKQKRSDSGNELDLLKNEVSELKNMLAQLLEKVNTNGIN